jgi:hypothetical protein
MTNQKITVEKFELEINLEKIAKEVSLKTFQKDS